MADETDEVFTLVASAWAPGIQDEAEGVTELFADSSSLTSEMILFDNSYAKIIWQLNSFNIATAEHDAVMAALSEYAADSYSLSMTMTWEATDVPDDGDIVGWFIYAAGEGASGWTMQNVHDEDGNDEYVAADVRSFFIDETDWDVSDGADGLFDFGTDLPDTEVLREDDGTTGFNGTWWCDEVTHPTTSTVAASCHRYLPQVATSYIRDFRYSPLSEENNALAPEYQVYAYFYQTDGAGTTVWTASDTSAITLNGAAAMAAAASCLVAGTLMI